MITEGNENAVNTKQFASLGDTRATINRNRSLYIYLFACDVISVYTVNCQCVGVKMTDTFFAGGGVLISQ